MEGKTKEQVDKTGMIDTWLKKHRLMFTGATRHPFILAIFDGSVDLSSFKTWLGQEYMFVREFVPFEASVLIKASKESDERSDMDVVLSGVAALNDKIEWFKKEAPKWGVELSSIVPHKATQNYCRFLDSQMSKEVEYPVAMTILCVIETVYHESFAHCLEHGNKAPAELTGACQLWANDGFGEYCLSLKQIANRCLEKASDDDVLKKAEIVLLRVLEHNVEFWNMCRGQS